MTNKEFAEKCRAVAEGKKTLYVLGGWGQPLTDANKSYFKSHYAFNRGADTKNVQASTLVSNAISKADSSIHAFDCVCFVKSLLDGYTGSSAAFGGATYGKPCADVTIKQMLSDCTDVSSDLSNLTIGEFMCYSNYGHCGIYVGDGLVCECTYGFENGVQLIDMNCASRKGLWKYHGKLTKYMTYASDESTTNTSILKGFATARVVARKGDTGDYVKAIQQVLIDKGYSCGGTGADGDFGNNTYKAVYNFQTASNLVADGVVGFDTLTELLK